MGVDLFCILFVMGECKVIYSKMRRTVYPKMSISLHVNYKISKNLYY